MDELNEELQACKMAIQSLQALKLEVQQIKNVITYQDEEIFKFLMTRKWPTTEKLEDNGVLERGEEKSAAVVTAPVEPTRPKKPANVLPQIEPLSVEEFEDIPKYLKGRILISAINKLIKDMNATIVEKYKLLRTPRSKLNDNQMKMVKEFKAQECEETKGVYFCVDSDLKFFAGVKADKQFNNFMNILRHCKRVQDIRSAGGIVRHAVVNRFHSQSS